MLLELFKRDPQHPFMLPRSVVPLCNNSLLDRIRAMMPLCDSHGIVPTWQEPADDVVRDFFFRFSVSRQMNYGISLSGVPHIKSVMWI